MFRWAASRSLAACFSWVFCALRKARNHFRAAGKGNADGHQIADTEAQSHFAADAGLGGVEIRLQMDAGSGMRVSFSTSGITVHMATLAQP